ncbi:adenylate/guanylate cyclase domain-containing protein [Opitutus sp. GAS368]|uniref:CHASE2 domain-containing protein n=1 Tax=Opitutus sp. GAS368 TaxID=1882749 RepID=UPI00087CC6F0|nr:adenylate/guanylate cyclase domain-containing protein [Opitutus sp. GAS368]SDR68421.1 adenylate cyclase [Opitutus sp. GAS368]
MLSHARKTFRQIWWAPLVCFGLAWLADHYLGVVQQAEWHTLDWRTQFRAYSQPPPDPRLVIVLFEDDTDANLTPWPPDRAWHGNFNKFLAVEKPAVISWDVILDARREGEGDAAMGRDTKAAVDSGVQVVTAAVTSSDPPEYESPPVGPTRPLTHIEGDISQLYSDRHALVPFPALKAIAPYGFADAPRTTDGVIREVPLVIRLDGQVFPSLALQTVMCFYHIPPEKVRVRPGDGIYLPVEGGERRIPISATGRYTINYRFDQEADGTRFDFPTHTYREMLLKIQAYHVDKTPNAAKPPNIAGKIVFVGQTVTGKADAGPTQRNAYSPLVLVHANIVNNILNEDYVRPVPPALVWSLALLLGWLGLAVMADRSVIVLCGGAVLGIVSYTSAAVWAWVWGNWQVPLVPPLAGFAALQFIVIGRRILEEQRGRQAIKGMFGAYLSPQLVDRMVKSGQMPELGGHQEEITAYFSDIQGYSTFSEKLSAARLVELLNEYLTVCTDIIQEEGGTLDKYIGDAVVAMFGAPIALPDHAYRACVTALRVQRALEDLRQRWAAQGETWPLTVRQMRSRIGLNSGVAVVGNMGSRTRFSYTMTSDDVNLAARMESGAKSWGAYTMCSEATKAACEQHGGDRVVFRPLGRIVVKGRAQAVPIHEIVGLKEHVTPTTHECLALFSQGLARYYERDWAGAETLFRRSAALEPNLPGQTPGVSSNPSLVFLDITAHYAAHPPAADWDGVYVMKEK